MASGSSFAHVNLLTVQDAVSMLPEFGTGFGGEPQVMPSVGAQTSAAIVQTSAARQAPEMMSATAQTTKPYRGTRGGNGGCFGPKEVRRQYFFDAVVRREVKRRLEGPWKLWNNEWWRWYDGRWWKESEWQAWSENQDAPRGSGTGGSQDPAPPGKYRR